MQADTFAPLFTDWEIPPAVTATLVAVAAIYIRGWFQIRRTRPEQFPAWRLYCFLGGIVSLFIAVASPLDTFSESLLFMHMAQHYVFMSLAPPLIAFGAPVVPMLRGLPRWMVRRVLGPLFRTHTLHRIGQFLTRPRVAWLAFNVMFLGWHVPAAYELALSSENWHNFEHGCFFFASLLFWWPILEPWPFRLRVSRWTLVPYLLLADFVNTGLSAFLCFAGRLVYPSYGDIVPRPFGISALDDQVAAGALMWVLGSIVFLIPAMAILINLLSSGNKRRRKSPQPRLSAQARP